MARTDPLNTARYWRDRHFDGLTLMHADFHTQSYAPHSHDAVVVAATELGGSEIRSRGVVDQATASTLYVFNPAEPHSGDMGGSRHWRYRALYLERPALDAVSRGLGVDALPYFLRNRFEDPDLIAGFLALHRCLQDGTDSFQARERTLAAFGTLFRRHGSGGGRIEPGPRDRRRLKAAIDILQGSLSGPPSLDDLGCAMGLTPFQLIGLFKRTTGLTPHAYLTQLRLQAACRHLAAGAPIAEAALASGFYDQSALTRQFKRCYGVTPRQFARAARG